MIVGHDITSDPALSAENTSILEQLQKHRTLGAAPREELAWLVARGGLRRFKAGEIVIGKGEDVGDNGVWVIFSGHFTVYVDRGAGPRRIADWRAGDITGILPFSRTATALGNGVALEDLELFEVQRHHFPELIRECPQVTAILVHVMIDRTRDFTTGDLHDEKMVSLGKLAAGMAHELNNPASAVTRQAAQLEHALDELTAATRALGAANLSTEQQRTLDSFRESCSGSAAKGVESPLDRADREDAIDAWLRAHGVDPSCAPALVESGVTITALDQVSIMIAPSSLGAAVRWIAADCATRTLLADMKTAASRIYDLVGAVKRYTYMDRGAAAEPVDVVQGLRDTVAVMRSKAREKECELKLDVKGDIPPVRAVGGELNQIWSNLIDNALDAVPNGGHVVISARAGVNSVVVSVSDDGPGIPADLTERIFDPFYTTKPVGKGTGLGLDIARRLARRHGGDIDVESNAAQRRTEFHVELPISQV